MKIRQSHYVARTEYTCYLRSVSVTDDHEYDGQEDDKISYVYRYQGYVFTTPLPTKLKRLY